MLDIAAIKARWAAATNGWNEDNAWQAVDDGVHGWMVLGSVGHEDNDAESIQVAEVREREDAEFIAAAHADVPALVAVVEAMRAAMGALVDEAESTYGDYCEDVWGPRRGLRDAVDAACELLGRPKPD